MRRNSGVFSPDARARVIASRAMPRLTARLSRRARERETIAAGGSSVAALCLDCFSRGASLRGEVPFFLSVRE